MKKQFSFYGTHLWSTVQDRIQVLTNEIVQYYQGKLVEQDQYVGIAESLLNYYRGVATKQEQELIV